MKHIQLLHEKLVDRCGIFVSLACLVHCMALPLIYALFPALLQRSNPWSAHFILALFVLVFAAYSMLKGFLHHGNKFPLLFALLGATSIIVALSFSPVDAHTHFDLDLHTALTVVGSIMLVLSHTANLRSCRVCNCEKSQTSNAEQNASIRRLAVIND